MKKICIALDYNPSAEKVAKTGYAYAKSMNAQVFLIHVLEDASFYAMEYTPILGYTNTFLNSNTKVVSELIKGAEVFLSTSAEHLGSSAISTEVLEGDTADTILDYCDENHMDLLVIGTHSHSIVEKVLMGNVAVKVVRHTKIPLLVVPTKN